jgi:hypothetical protein
MLFAPLVRSPVGATLFSFSLDEESFRFGVRICLDTPEPPDTRSGGRLQGQSNLKFSIGFQVLVWLEFSCPDMDSAHY